MSIQLHTDITVGGTFVGVTRETVFDKIAGWEQLPVDSLKPGVREDDLEHKNLLQGEFWRNIPLYEDVDTETFLDYAWQSRNSVTNPKRLRKTLRDLVPEEFFQDVEEGFRQAPMSMRVSPYLVALINWQDP